ncbi:ABC transporter permease [Acidimangrovimonas sediminis]|uniref:ABC transporter permease n=1 Tax=Acidimangrovimonas sediminis TaxID=2056283 RepID=UPI000C80866E|nr:FtsX family ABC transporter permease [Acidimangrovimonas sediminis]
MRALDRKLLRDLRRLWAQSLAIALVLGCGVMVLVLATATERSLTLTRDTYYDRARFAEVFATATRAPRSLLPEIARIPGVAQVEARVAMDVVLDMPGLARPAQARVLSLPEDGAPVLNRPTLRQGRMPTPGSTDDVAISENFGLANGLHPGDSFSAILNGQKRQLRVTGLMLSPEFIYLIGPGMLMPDDRHYGIIWMNEAPAAAAAGLTGAFDDVSLRLTRGASEPAVIAALDRLLAPYGGTGAHGRDRQVSDMFLRSEMDGLNAMALILPPIFLIVSAFLVNMVLSRLIGLERPIVGLLKAMGYSGREIAWHYLKLSIGIGVLGVLIGWIAGWWLGAGLTRLYTEFYRFPYLIYAPGSTSFAISGLMGMATVVLGALRAVRASARLHPAVAMSPPAPPLFRRGLLDRVAQMLRLRQTTMMILRSITRWPRRAAVTSLGVAAAISVLVACFFTFDSIAAVIDEAFTRTNRQNVTLQLTHDAPTSVIEAAAHLPGVMRVEGAYSLPVRLIHGPQSELTSVEARGADDMLTRVLDASGGAAPLPPEGIVLPESLAAKLDVRAGDSLRMALLVPPRETLEIRVSALMRQSLGETAHLSAPALFRLMRVAPQVNRLNLLVDTPALPALYAAVKDAPAIEGAQFWADIRQKFDETLNRNLTTSVTVYAILGILITVGVIYNAARIQLSERSYELASLRVLGFTRAEVGYVLVGELMLLTLLAIPPGLLGGYAFSALVAQGFTTDIVRIPLVISRRTYALAALIAVAAALAAALMVRRRLDRVSLATALKKRD